MEEGACMGKLFMKPVIAAGERRAESVFIMLMKHYDHGRIFFQASFNLSRIETAETLAEKIHAMEYQHYPVQIARWLERMLKA